ncbi:MAG: ribonuclease III [Rhodovibrio sp.]|nr:ribonuclease III [Rhodovibrio sp.]
MASTDEPEGTTDLERLSERLGYRFADPRLLRQALTHSSATGHQRAELVSYERLEFLGDRVLGLIVADLLLDRFPDEPEGRSPAGTPSWSAGKRSPRSRAGSGWASSCTSPSGEAEGGGRDNPTMLADVCEAVIGALYRDSGLEAARRFVVPSWEPLVRQDRKPPQDSKTALQEWAQGRGLPLPSYTVVARSGPPHDPRSRHRPGSGTGDRPPSRR